MSKPQPLPARRVIAYVDGFNLYFGLKESGWQQLYWLDICKLARALLPPNCTLAEVKYFSALVSAPEAKRKRQTNYLEALETFSECGITLGKYQTEERYCPTCYAVHQTPQEKMTDVNIAVSMMEDAFQSHFDLALLISGDSDLTPPVAAVRRMFPEKAVVVAFPPKRSSSDLAAAANDHFVISRKKLKDCQLPDELTKPDGYVLRRPQRWTKTGS